MQAAVIRPSPRCPRTRAEALAADAVAKLVQAGILPVSEALGQLGYTPEDAARIRAARRGDALDGAAVTLDGLLSAATS